MFAQVFKTKFRGSSRGMPSHFRFLSWVFSTVSSTSLSISMTKRRPALTACAWFSITPAWIPCPSSVCPWSQWCPSARSPSTSWTLSTSPATSISTCFLKSRERQTQVKVYKTRCLWFICLLSRHCVWREEGEEEEPAAGLGGHLRHHCVPVPHNFMAGRLLSQRGTFHYFTQTSGQSFFQNGMDSSVRALIVAFSTDFYYCLYCPALVLYACPSVRRNCRLLTGFSVTPSSKSRNVFRQALFWFL